MNWNKLFFFQVMMLLTSAEVWAQVNAYAKVTGISGKTLTISNVNETFHTFEDGEYIIIMQMQDDVIGDVTNNSTFGNLGSIQAAGQYEVAVIATHTENGAGVPTSVTVTNNLTNSYNIGSNSSVQIISYRLYGNPHYTTTANMVALDWDGNVGGVLAVRVNGTLTVAHDLTADGAGFRGGPRSSTGNTLTCAATNWIAGASGDTGRKGEGIYKISNSTYTGGRAKILNGGGAGVLHNSGGGGGGNYTAGGEGGPGYNCTATPVGGLGGIDLSTMISSSRIFMGGGGGGAQQNNGLASSGVDGGGIILIKATTIATTGSLGTKRISASGLTAADARNDGGGGGGAGGTIVLDVTTFSVAAGTPLLVSANGGNGGNIADSRLHGGGGGGGQGRVFYSTARPVVNVTTTSTNGTGGCNNNSSPCTSQASSASGVDNTGISDNTGATPLPVHFVYVKGYYDDAKQHTVIAWATSLEVNNNFFTVERSKDGQNFTALGRLAGAGTSQALHQYDFMDAAPSPGRYYYRVMQTDWDGNRSYSAVVQVEVQAGADAPVWAVYPNPQQRQHDVNIMLYHGTPGPCAIEVMTVTGRIVYQATTTVEDSMARFVWPNELDASGVYIVTLRNGNFKDSQKIVIH